MIELPWEYLQVNHRKYIVQLWFGLWIIKCFKSKGQPKTLQWQNTVTQTRRIYKHVIPYASNVNRQLMFQIKICRQQSVKCNLLICRFQFHVIVLHTEIIEQMFSPCQHFSFIIHLLWIQLKWAIIPVIITLIQIRTTSDGNVWR